MCKYWLETSSSSSNKKIWDGRLAAVAVVLSGSDGRAEVAPARNRRVRLRQTNAAELDAAVPCSEILLDFITERCKTMSASRCCSRWAFSAVSTTCKYSSVVVNALANEHHEKEAAAMHSSTDGRDEIFPISVNPIVDDAAGPGNNTTGLAVDWLKCQ
jgi:hypothetical protein